MKRLLAHLLKLQLTLMYMLSTKTNFSNQTVIKLKLASMIHEGLGVSGNSVYKWQFLGFTNTQTSGTSWNSGNITNTAINRIGFATYSGQLYAISCNGTNITTVCLGTYSAPLMNQYQI